MKKIENKNQKGGFFEIIKLKNNLPDILVIISAIVIVVTVNYLMNKNAVLNSPIIFGDAGLSNVNASYFFIFGSYNPWFTLFYKVFFYGFPSYFGYAYNTFGYIPIALMPVTMYVFLKKLRISMPGRIVGSIMYPLNPILLIWGGWEYGGPLLFLPLIVMSIISYLEDQKLYHLIISVLWLFIMVTLLGFVEIKLIAPLLIPFLLWVIFCPQVKSSVKAVRDIAIAATFSILLALPLILNIFGAFSEYSTAFISSSMPYSTEKSIVQYVFQSSTLENSIMGLTIYPGTFLQVIKFTTSWFYLLWVFIVFSAISSVFLHKGTYKKLYYLILLFNIILILFQFGVYNGTLLFLYKNPFIVIYNYPLFFNIMQMFIYSILFALFVDYIVKKMNFNGVNIKYIQKFLNAHSSKIISIVMVAVVLLSVFPIVSNSNGNGTLGQNPSNFAEPGYWSVITHDLASYQTQKTLILPNNDTSLTYLDGAIPYSNVFGLPYNYQAFPTEFPNQSLFYNLSMDFADNNIAAISNILIQQDIEQIVVVNMHSNSPIIAGESTIEGGGQNFAKIINETNLYEPLVVTTNFIIYEMRLNNNITFPSNLPSSSSLYTDFINETLNANSFDVTSGKYSHLSIPIYIKDKGNPNGEYYQQRIFVPSNLSSNINSNFSNIYFAYNNGTLIPAWIQNYNSSGATIWLNLTSSSSTIYLWIFPKYYNLLSSQGFLGEAPELSSIYGKYDNGANVFPFYTSFTSVSELSNIFSIYSENSLLPNYTLQNGLLLGSNANFISKQHFGYGTLFGKIEYMTPNTFGSGGAFVAHNVALLNGSHPASEIIYNTNNQAMFLTSYASSKTDSYFHFNTLYNFSLTDNGKLGIEVLGNYSYSSILNNFNSSFIIQLQNQPASGNNGTIYIPYIAYTDTVSMPSYSYGNITVQQGVYKNKIIDNPGDSGVSLRFEAYALNPQTISEFEWKLLNKTFIGETLNYTFLKSGKYNIEVIALGGNHKLIKLINFTETILNPLNATLSSNKLSNENNFLFNLKITGGTDEYYIHWWVDYLPVNSNNQDIEYNFTKGGTKIVQVLVMDSGGGKILLTEKVSISSVTSASKVNPFIVIYNITSLASAILLLIILPIDSIRRK